MFGALGLKGILSLEFYTYRVYTEGHIVRIFAAQYVQAAY